MNLSTFKGWLGESVINISAFLTLDRSVYFRLNNVTLPLSNGGTTQIDHIIVSKFGIFVIETKNYKGDILGGKMDAQWTQVVSNDKGYADNEYKFQNPLRQNYLHTKTLADLLNINHTYFHSVIAFGNRCQLKTIDELPENVMQKGVMRYIKKKQKVLLSEKQAKEVYREIKDNRLKNSRATNAKHKAFVKQKQASHSLNTSSENSAQNPEPNSANNFTDENPPECPKCQSTMVKRVSKQSKNVGSEFWGCSQYPKCRGIVNINS